MPWLTLGALALGFSGVVLTALFRRRRGEDPSEGVPPSSLQESPITQEEIRLRLRLLENMPHGVYEADEKGVLLYSNTAYHRMHGYAPGELLGKPLTLLLSEEAHREDFSEYYYALMRDAPPPSPYEGIHRTLDGRDIHVRVEWEYRLNAQGQVCGTSGVVTDITSEVRIHSQLRDNQQLMRAIFDALPVWISVKNTEGIYVMVNQKSLQDLGLQESDYLGKHTLELKAGTTEEMARKWALDQQVIQTGVMHSSDIVTQTLVTGQVRHYQHYKTAFRLAEGGIGGVVTISMDFTDQLRVEEALRRSQQLLEAAIETIPHGMFAKDRESRYLFANSAMARHYGLTKEDFLGRTPDEIEGLTPEDRKRIYWQDQRVINSGNLVDEVVSSPLRTGEISIRHDIKLPLRDEAGNITGLVGISEDITELRRVVEELRDRERRLNEAQRLTHMGGWTWNIASGKLTWSDEIYRIFGMVPGVQTLDVDNFLTFVHPEDRAAVQQAVDLALSGKDPYTCEHRIVLPDGSQRIVQETGELIRDEAGKPVLMNGTVMDITERKEVEARLRNNERHLREAQRIAHIGSWIRDYTSDALTWSEEVYRIFGLDPAVITATSATFMERVHPEDRDLVKRELLKAAQGDGQYRCEHRVVRPNGEIRIVMEQGEIISDRQGRPIRSTGTVQDITERKEFEARLQESEKHLKEAQRIAQMGSWSRDYLTDTLTWSEEVYRIFGLDPSLGAPTFSTFAKHVPLEDLVQDREQIRKAVEGNGQYTSEHRVNRPDGAGRIVLERGEIIRDSQGRHVRTIGTVQDITDQKETERLMRERQAHLEEAQRIARLGSWSRHLETGNLTWSTEVFRMFGQDPATFKPTYETFMSQVHPEDRAAVISAIQSLREGQSSYKIEHRLIRPDGTLAIVEEIGELVRDALGRPHRTTGTVRDITRQKAVEEQLRRLNEDLEQLVTERTRELLEERNFIAAVVDTEEALVVVLDRHGRVVRFNPSCERVTGFTQQEMIGRKIWDDLIPHEERAGVQQVFQNITAGMFPNTHENDWLHRDGTRHRLSWANSAIVDKTGQVEFIIGTGIDITLRQKAEQERDAALARLEFLLGASPAVIYAANPQIGASFVSPNISPLLGYTPEDLINNPWFLRQNIHPEDLPRIEQELVRLEKQGRAAYEYRLKNKGGDYRWIRDHVQMVYTKENKPREVIGVWLDVTERVAAEQKVNDMREELLRKQKLATLGQLTATVSHELRNPLGTITSSLFVVQERIKTLAAEGLVRPLERIQRNVQRCDHIITDLLDFSRTRPSHPEPTLVDPWLKDLIEEQSIPTWLKLVLRLKAPGLQLDLDRDHLRRVVINLFENAVQALAQHRETHPDWPCILEVQTAREHSQFKMRFVDSGPGIPPAVLARMFEPLFSTKNFGVGLGLPIVRQIMHQEGGDVDITSGPDGTTAQVWLKIEEERISHDPA
ncbi:MAG: PAS domain-containing protein [Deltaproteobacteria bacterium]|nr:PAS domain-containing protein [Deltaproteobacteria bacterium]